MSQGKTAIPGLDDGEELRVTDVRNRMEPFNIILIFKAFNIVSLYV